MKSDVDKLLKKNVQLNQLDLVKVASHVQREIEDGDWVVNTQILSPSDGYLRSFVVGEQYSVTATLNGTEYEQTIVNKILIELNKVCENT